MRTRKPRKKNAHQIPPHSSLNLCIGCQSPTLNFLSEWMGQGCAHSKLEKIARQFPLSSSSFNIRIGCQSPTPNFRSEWMGRGSAHSKLKKKRAPDSSPLLLQSLYRLSISHPQFSKRVDGAGQRTLETQKNARQIPLIASFNLCIGFLNSPFLSVWTCIGLQCSTR